MTPEQQNQPDWLPYLHFGYLPPQEPVLPFEPPGNLVTLPADLNRAATQAGDVLSRAVHAAITPGRTNYIPLSGGLDSRAWLAAAMEAGAEVETLTFGMPGTMDYEYGNRVARAVGCPHRSLNLHDHLPNTAALVDTVRNGGQWTYTFDTYFNRLLTRQMGSEPIVLHGFVGDPVAGSHYNPNVPDDGRAMKAFVDSQRYTRVLLLTRPEDEPATWLPAIDAIPEVPGLTTYERLDFCIRQVGGIRPIVIDPTADVRTPSPGRLTDRAGRAGGDRGHLADRSCDAANPVSDRRYGRLAGSRVSLRLFYSREGRESQDAALLMSVVGQFVASSWAAHGCRGVLQVLSRGGFPFPEGYTAA